MTIEIEKWYTECNQKPQWQEKRAMLFSVFLWVNFLYQKTSDITHKNINGKNKSNK